MRVWQFPTDVYNRDLIFAHGTAEELSRFFGEPADKWSGRRGAYFRTHKKKYGFIVDVICVVHRRKTEWTDHQMLAHEVNHFVIHVLEFLGVPINNDASEAFTYYADFTTRRILRIWKGKA